MPADPSSPASARRGVAVSLRGLRKAYGTQQVLDGVDLDVAPGELVAIVGQSGQGKSVLLRQLIGLERPDAGTIAVGGMPLERWVALPADAKPFRIAMVFQGAALLASLTVAENVALRLEEHGGASRAAVRLAVAETLAAVDLAGVEDKLPAELSGGMRKRVAIARALAAEPHLILYDEPTADLDPLLTEQIAQLIARVRRARGATQLVVTHNLPLARTLADRIAVLDAGRIVEYAAPDALRASRHALVRELLRASALGTELSGGSPPC